MPTRSATSRKWRARTLQALRAAAFLAIATGVNWVLSDMFPRYEPIYVYLVAVVIVAWIGSALLGVTAAVAATILYDWMFAPVRVVPHMSIAVPLAIAVLVAIAVRAAKMPLRERAALPEPVQVAPLLPVIDAVPAPAAEVRAVETKVVIDDTRIRELEAHNAQLRRQIADLTKETENLRQQITEHTGRFALVRHEADALADKLRNAEARASEESDRADRESRMRERLEGASQETLEKTLAELAAKHDAAMAEVKQRADIATKRAESLQTAVTNERARADHESGDFAKAISASAEKVKVLQRDLELVRSKLAEEHDRAEREMQLRSQLEAAARETLSRTAVVSTSHQRDAEAARETLRAANERIRQLEREVEQARAAGPDTSTHDDLQEKLDAERERFARMEFEWKARLDSQREDLDREFDAKLQTIVQNITQDHENAIGEAVLQREAAKAEVRSLTQRLQELQTKAADVALLRAAEEARTAAETEAAVLRNQVEAARLDAESARNDMMSLLDEREASHAELVDAKQRLARVEFEWKARLESQKEDLDREFDGKLQKIVQGLTEDHENAIGDALLEREAAKAELRRLTQRAQELERTVDDERRRANEEKTARERLDAEWNAKLEKIVTHLTEDHESDVGEAMLQREAAKAEVRNLTAKLAAAQKQIEDEREKFRQFAIKRTGTTTPTVEQKIPTVPLSRPRVILVVHRDAGIRAMAKHTLQQDGYIVLTAADGLEALRTAAQNKPDVILTEAVMPKMNARELVQLLKSKRETADVKIVLLASNGEIGRGADFTADEIVRNPADFNELRSTLANVLARGVRTG